MTRLLTLLFALLLAIPLAAQQQGVPFNGIVSDISGAPVKGARIYISKGRVARSDKKGRFGLTDVAATDTIHIYFKKRTYDIPVEGRKSLRVRLGDQLQAQEDQELVNWGYGFVKKRESLEISSGISGEDLVRSGYTNITMALQGRALNDHGQLVRDDVRLLHDGRYGDPERGGADARYPALARFMPVAGRHGNHRAECGCAAAIRPGRHAAVCRRGDGRELRKALAAHIEHGSAAMGHLCAADRAGDATAQVLRHEPVRLDLPLDGHGGYGRLLHQEHVADGL